jgi:hypothetical protein
MAPIVLYCPFRGFSGFLVLPPGRRGRNPVCKPLPLSMLQMQTGPSRTQPTLALGLFPHFSLLALPPPAPQPRPVWSIIAFAINPTPPTASNVGLGWISLDSGPDSPQFSSIHLNPVGSTCTLPDSPGLRNCQGSAPAPGAAADALVRRHERVSASSLPSFLPRPKPSLSATAAAKEGSGRRFPRPRGKPRTCQNRHWLFRPEPRA